MKSLLKFLILVTISSVGAAEFAPIQSVILDEHAIVSVPVSTNRVTTISFPGPSLPSTEAA